MNVFPNWSKKGPIVGVRFEIFDTHKTSLGIKTKKFLFDSGNENGLMLPLTYIEDFGLDINNLSTVIVSSPGTSGTNQHACLVTIHEINVGSINILERSFEKQIPLVFSSNPNQTPIIGQTPFFEYVCCINYKHENFSIEKPSD